jgi:asparagine synthase (glutamine-hydrolysing)
MLACLAPGFSRAFAEFSRPEITFPLISQPIIEVCLRTPTYTLIDGGWDRSTARRAFADLLPREIVRRRAKGGADHLAREILDANASFIRERLLGGTLSREKLIDRRQLERYFQEMRTGDEIFCNRAVTLVGLELFLENWESAARQTNGDVSCLDTLESERTRAAC